MPKKTVCIFAHPDDEAFGPSGTIAKFAQEGEVSLICVTDGNDHTNGTKGLSDIRKGELKKSASILGVKRVYFLGFPDGELCNNIYHKIVKKIQKVLDVIKPDTLITFEPRGVSGHIDHIFCSMISSYIFRETKHIKKLLYFCIPKLSSNFMKDYFIYFPPGYSKKEVDLIINVSEFWDLKIKSLKCHQSQKKDVDEMLGFMKLAKFFKFFPREEYFLTLKK